MRSIFTCIANRISEKVMAVAPINALLVPAIRDFKLAKFSVVEKNSL